MDYPDTQYHPDSDSSLGVIRTPRGRGEDNLKIPYGEQFGGTSTGEPPFTGNGFTKSTNGQIVPEYAIQDNKAIKLQDGAELWEIGKDGSETLRGVYDGFSHKFVLPSLKE